MAKRAREIEQEQENDRILGRDESSLETDNPYVQLAPNKGDDAAQESNGHDGMEAGGTDNNAGDQAQTNGGSESDSKRKGKPDEHKRADFSRLASNRASNALDALTSLGHLANTTNYLWTEEQEHKIFNTIADRLDALRKSFAGARIAAEAPDDGTKRSKRNRAFSVAV